MPIPKVIKMVDGRSTDVEESEEARRKREEAEARRLEEQEERDERSRAKGRAKTEAAENREADAVQLRQSYYDCERRQKQAQAELEDLRTQLGNRRAGVDAHPEGPTIEDIRERIDTLERDLQEIGATMRSLNTQHHALTGVSIDRKLRTISAG